MSTTKNQNQNHTATIIGDGSSIDNSSTEKGAKVGMTDLGELGNLRDNGSVDESIDGSANDFTEPKKGKLSKKLIRIAYAVIIFTSFVESFAMDSTSELSTKATSAFKANPLVATAATVYKITAICAYPVLGKLADLLGRAEGFGICVTSYTLCYILFAVCKNVETYISGEVFLAIGRIGFKIYLLIFIADNSNLLNRGLLSQLPSAISGIPSTYAGSHIQDAFVEHSTWRWAYGAFAIILGVSAIPLTLVMWYVDRIQKKNNLRKQALITRNLPKEGSLWTKICFIFFNEIDGIGFCLLVIASVLFFLPFSITGKSAPHRWDEARTICMIVFGFTAWVAFFVWCFWAQNLSRKFEYFKKRIPFIPLSAFKNHTILIAFLLVCLDYTEQSCWVTYFSTTAQVGGYLTLGQTSRIASAKKITIDIASVITGVFMKYTKRSKIFVLVGIPLLVLSHGLLVWFMNRDGVMERRLLFYVANIIFGVGRAFYQVSLQVTIQALAGVEGIAVSTAFFQAFSIIGSLIGTAIAGGMWNGMVVDKLNEYLPQENRKNATKIFKNINVAMSYKEGTPARTAISLAYREVQQTIGWVSLGLIGPMLILMFFIREVELTDKNDVYGNDFNDESSGEMHLDEKIEKRQKYLLEQEKRTWKNFWRV